MTGVKRDPVFVDPLHERHRRILVLQGLMEALLLQNWEDPGRRILAGLAARNRRNSDQGAAPVEERQLV